MVVICEEVDHTLWAGVVVRERKTGLMAHIFTIVLKTLIGMGESEDWDMYLLKFTESAEKCPTWVTVHRM